MRGAHGPPALGQKCITLQPSPACCATMADTSFTSPLTDAARGDDGSPRALFTVSPPYAERTLSRREALLAQAAQAAPGGRRSAALLALAGADVQATARVPSAAEQVQSDVQPHHVPPSPLWVAATPGYSSDSDSSSIAAGGSPEATPASADAAAEAAEDARAVERLTATVMTLADGMASARQPAWRTLPAEHGEGVDDSAEEVAAAEAAVADAADALGCAIVALRAAVGARCVRLEARASDAEREARGASFDAARKIAAEQHRNAALRLENATLAAELEAAKQARGARGARCHCYQRTVLTRRAGIAARAQELAAARRRASLAAAPLPPRMSASVRRSAACRMGDACC